MKPSNIRGSAAIGDVMTSRAKSMVSSRMLILRSKLLMLRCAQRLFDLTRDENDLKRVERLRADLHRAETSFAAIEMRTNSEGRSFNRSWMYRNLIEVAKTTMATVLERHHKETAAEQFELATDIQMLEELVERWSEAMREEGGRRDRAALG